MHCVGDATGGRLIAELQGVSVVREGRSIVDCVDWQILQGQSWLVLGPNGSGKTTLLGLLSAQDHPTSGSVSVLGQRLGGSDLRRLRRRIGIASPALARRLRPSMTALEVVVSGMAGQLETWWGTHPPSRWERARCLLEEMGVGMSAEQEIGTLSTGELRRVQIARALACEPELLLLDEPASGLDLAGRELVLSQITAVVSGPNPPKATVMVTHHLEEIPKAMTHALLLSGGKVSDAGPIGATITSANITRCFGVDLKVVRNGDRFASVG